MSKPRRMELHRRQRRKRSLADLRARYNAAASESAKREIFAKVTRISPLLSQAEFSKASS